MEYTPSIDPNEKKLICFGIAQEMSKETARIYFPIGDLWFSL